MEQHSKEQKACARGKLRRLGGVAVAKVVLGWGGGHGGGLGGQRIGLQEAESVGESLG